MYTLNSTSKPYLLDKYYKKNKTILHRSGLTLLIILARYKTSFCVQITGKNVINRSAHECGDLHTIMT